MPITSRKAYPIPDEPEPEGYHCVRFYVPKDSLYLGAFWQSLHFLASPRAWADDSDHTALVVADVWKAAIHKSQEMDTCAEGDCGIMDVRQKPDEPCTLQKLPDCSGEWEDFAVITNCTGAVPPGTQETSVAETLDALWATKETIETIHYLLISNTPTQVKYILGYMGIAGMNDTIDAMAAETEEDRQDAIDDMDWQEPFDAIWCDRTGCLLGNFSSPFSYQWVVCFLRNLENWSADTAGLIADWSASLINDIVPKSFMDMVNMLPGGGESFGFNEPICHWEKIFTWDTSQEEWELAQVNGQYAGAFSSPRGWSESNDGVYIVTLQENINIHYIKMKIYTEDVVLNCHWYIKLLNGETWETASSGVRSQGYADYVWSSGTPVQRNGIMLILADYPTPSGPAWMEDVTVRGSGENPWE